MAKNTILSIYEDKYRQMLAIKSLTEDFVYISHRTNYPTKSNKFVTFKLDEVQLGCILNNSLAKPYHLNLNENNLIVDGTSMQFIISTGDVFTSLDIPTTTAVINFFKEAYDNLIKCESNTTSCNHRNIDYSSSLRKVPDGVECLICGETFKLLDESNIDEITNSLELVLDTIETIKACDHTLTKKDLVEYGNLIESITNLKPAFEKALECIK